MEEGRRKSSARFQPYKPPSKKASTFTSAARNALQEAIDSGANENKILNDAQKLAQKWQRMGTKKKTPWTNAEVLKWMSRRTKNEPTLNIPTLMNIALQTNLPVDKFEVVYKKISTTRGGSTSALLPYIVQNLDPSKIAKWTAIFSRLDETMRKFAEASLRTAHSGSEFETIAVATAAQSVEIPVVYFLDAKNFPSKSLKDILAARYDASLRSTGILILKTRLDLTPLKKFETNSNYKKAWFLQLMNNSTPASISGVKKLYGRNNLNYSNLTAGLVGKSQNNSQWKGYSDVEPDAIFMYYLPDGRLRADVFEFKIGAGKPEAVPAEAYQLAKAKRSIELIPEFAQKSVVVKTHFFPLKYGQRGNRVNFYDPKMHNNVFSRTFKKYLGANFSVNVIEDKAEFTDITGIPIEPIEIILDALRKANLNNIHSRMNYIKRHSRVRAGVTYENWVKTKQSLQMSHPQTAPNARSALGSMFNRRMAATVGLRPGANVRAALIRRGPLNTELINDIYRSIKMLDSQGVKFVNKHTGKPMNVKEVLEYAPLVTGILSNNPSNVKKYSNRLKAWQKRRSTENIRGIFAGLPELKNVEFVEPSPNNKMIQGALEKVMTNALKAENLNPIINSLIRVKAPQNTWKSIIKNWANKNATDARRRTAYALLIRKGVSVANVQAIFS